MEAGKGTPTSEGMLANFFNSLLNKSTAKTPGATKAGKEYLWAPEVQSDVPFPLLSYYMLLYSSTQLFSPWLTLNTNLWWNKLNDEILSNLIKYLRNKLYTCTLRYVRKNFITTILLTWCYMQITLWID